MEALGRDKRFRNKCPLVTARALAPLKPLAELILPLLSVEGCAVAYKGPGAEEEIQAAEKIVAETGCTIDRVIPITIPGTDVARSLVVIEKRAETPARFPREVLKNPR